MKLNRLNSKIITVCVVACVAVAAVLLAVLLQKIGGSESLGAAQAVASGRQAASAAPSAELSSRLPPFQLSVWVAYWDWENGMNDLNAIPAKPDSVQAFAASFDSSDKLIFPEGMPGLIAELKDFKAANPGIPVYLTIVNDTVDAEGNWTDKDSGLLDRLMQPERRASHAADVLALAEQYGFDGVEIDYEKISDGAWEGFCDFCARLNTALEKNAKKMRVVLEPGAPVERGGLPADPEYIMMAYNLYGSGTDPGPKANDEFIRELAIKMRTIPDNKTMAFATGGYDWDSHGVAEQVDETEAYNLSKNGGEVQRDNGSGVLYFTYQKDGETHTVWYADSQTLRRWFDLSRALGIGNIAVWRMGGDSPETLQMMGGLQ